MSAVPASTPTIIIPIHNAPDELAACLTSVCRTVAAGTEVLLIDDASDDHRVRRVMAYWASQPGPAWRLEFQPDNLGFVGTVNRGMQMTGRDVVLLNSDTEVTEGWLEGMARCLSSGDAIATVTPWTNNGEIASLPAFCHSNPVPPDPDAVARVIRATGRALYPEIPTAVGFCMAISRRAIETLGLFDEKVFGLGYGEENDYSLRASAAGMHNLLCDEVYVVHHGGRSFGPKGLMPDQAAMDRLLSKHPGYLAQIQAFIQSDPLAARRVVLIDALENAGVAMG